MIVKILTNARRPVTVLFLLWPQPTAFDVKRRSSSARRQDFLFWSARSGIVCTERHTRSHEGPEVLYDPRRALASHHEVSKAFSALEWSICNTKTTTADNQHQLFDNDRFIFLPSSNLIDWLIDPETDINKNMPSSNGGRGGYKNKKENNGKDAAMIENVSFCKILRSFALFIFPNPSSGFLWIHILTNAGVYGKWSSKDIHWRLLSSRFCCAHQQR